MQLTKGPTSFANAMPDPNGKRIWALGVQPAGEFVKYDPRTKQFAPIVQGVSGTDLDFSRDGQWVAYVAIPEGLCGVAEWMERDRLRLTSPGQQVALPRWSPDGKQIAYLSDKNGEPWKILLIAFDGGVSRELLPEPRDQMDANWSPDGKQMVFGDIWQSTEPIRIIDLKPQAASR